MNMFRTASVTPSLLLASCRQFGDPVLTTPLEQELSALVQKKRLTAAEKARCQKIKKQCARMGFPRFPNSQELPQTQSWWRFWGQDVRNVSEASSEKLLNALGKARIFPEPAAEEIAKQAQQNPDFLPEGARTMILQNALSFCSKEGLDFLWNQVLKNTDASDKLELLLKLNLSDCRVLPLARKIIKNNAAIMRAILINPKHPLHDKLCSLFIYQPQLISLFSLQHPFYFSDLIKGLTEQFIHFRERSQKKIVFNENFPVFLHHVLVSLQFAWNHRVPIQDQKKSQILECLQQFGDALKPSGLFEKMLIDLPNVFDRDQFDLNIFTLAITNLIGSASLLHTKDTKEATLKQESDLERFISLGKSTRNSEEGLLLLKSCYEASFKKEIALFEKLQAQGAHINEHIDEYLDLHKSLRIKLTWFFLANFPTDHPALWAKMNALLDTVASITGLDTARGSEHPNYIHNLSGFTKELNVA